MNMYTCSSNDEFLLVQLSVYKSEAILLKMADETKQEHS